METSKKQKRKLTFHFWARKSLSFSFLTNQIFAWVNVQTLSPVIYSPNPRISIASSLHRRIQPSPASP